MIKKIIPIFIIIVLLFSSACGGSDEKFIDADTDEIILTIGDEKVSLGKALVFIVGEKNLLEDSFEDSGLWSINAFDKTVGQHLIDKMKSRIALVFTGALLADKKGSSLSDDDKLLVKKAADYFSNNLSSKSKDLLGIDDEDIYNIFYSYRMAICGYNDIINNSKIEVSQDESRVVKIQQINIKTANLSNEQLDEKTKKLNEAKAKIDKGDDFFTVASNYNEGNSIELTVSRKDLDSELEKTIFSLTRGQVSDIITTSDSLGIYKCVNSNVENLSENNREKLLNEKKNDYYLAELKEYIESYPILWDDNIWSQIDVSKISIKTEVGFFEVYDMFFPGG